MPRIALVGVTVCALAACGGTEPADTGPGDPVGLWNVTIESDELPPVVSTAKFCTVQWVMSLAPDGTGVTGQLITVVPHTATMSCDNHEPSAWLYNGNILTVRSTVDSLTFNLFPNDSAIVAVFAGGNRLSGRVNSHLFPGGTFTAVRRGGANPNLEPYSIETFSAPYPIDVGDSVALDVEVHDAYGQDVAPTGLSFTSTREDLATVSSQGTVHAVAPGLAPVEVRLGDLADTAEIEVLVPAASVEITQIPDSLIEPTTYLLQAVARDAQGGELFRSFHWTSSDASVATVVEFGPGGQITTHGPGTVTITARSTTHTDSAVLKVLPGVASIEIIGTDGTIPIAGTAQLSTIVRDAKGNVLTGRPVSWVADANGTVTIDQTGLAAAHRGGPGLVTAEAEQVQQGKALNALMDGPLTAVAAGYGHVCGLTDKGTVYCWGHASDGRFGPVPENGLPGPIPVATPHPFVSISANALHTCGLTAAKAAYCWGGNSFGQLGRGSVDGTAHPTPEAVSGGHQFVEIHGGASYACGLTASGEAWCWGINAGDALGLGTNDGLTYSAPLRAASAYTFTTLTTAVSLACGISTAGPVVCWGGGSTPAPLDATTGYTALGSGQHHACRIDNSGHLSCFGDLGFNLGYEPPEPVSAMTGGTDLTCVIPVGKKVRCWGLNDGGQIGGSTDHDDTGPVEVYGQP
jgi:hypothetical protein